MISKILMLTGAALLVTGALLHFGLNPFSWFGRLPGDLRFGDAERQVFIPLTSMILLSLALTLLLNLFFRR